MGFSVSKADREWSRAVRERDGGRCCICGSPSHPQAHHIVSRQCLATRHMPIVGILLCPEHHYFGALSAHQNPMWFLDWLRRHRRWQYEAVRKLQPVVAEYQHKVELLHRGKHRQAAEATIWKKKRKPERT